MRGKWLKIAAVVTGVVIVLAVALLILAKTLITPERVRSVVLPLAQEHLHRPVDLERIEVGLFSGISCRGLEIGDREGDEPFIRAEAVELHYRFWPLLLGRVMIDKVRLRGPVLRVVRHPDGNFNFSDLLAPGKEQSASVGQKQEDKEGAPINLLVSRVTVSGGRLVFVDQAVTAGQTVETDLSDLDLSAEDFSLRGPFPVTLAFQLNGAPVSWSGRVDPANKQASGQVRIDGLDVEALSPYFAEAFPGQIQSLKLSADLQGEGGVASFSSKGTLRLEGIGLSLNALPEAPIQDARLEIKHDLSADLEKGNLTIHSMRCVYNRLVLELTGEVFDYREAPRLDLRLKLPEVTLADAIQSLPAGLSRNFGASDFAGSLLGSVHLVGSLSKPETLPVEGEFKLKEVGARVGQLRSRLDGVLRLDKGKVSGQGLKIEVGDNQLLADIRAEHIFAKPVTLATTLRAETLKIDSLLPPGPEGEKGGSEPASGRAGGEGEEPGPFDLPLEMDGQAILGKVLYKDLTVKDVAIDWHLAQNVLRITRMDGKVASGSIKSKASVDLKRKGLAYDADLQASQVEAAPLVVTFFPKASGAVAGNIDLTMSLSGAGVQPENIKQNLRGDGSFAIRNGQLTGDGLMQGLGTYLDLDDLRVFRFDLGKGTFNIRNGALHLDASFTGSKARLFPSGKADFGNSLDLRLKTYLSPENTRKLAGKGTFGELMADEQGWGLIPLMVTGTFSRPKIALDRAAMTEQVKKGTKRKLQDKLEKKILKKIAPSEGEGKEEEPAKKLLEDTLRGLFGD